MPVFSEKCFAERFLEYSTLDIGLWHARRMECGELISLLYGPCEKVGGVALDPTEASVSAGIRVDLVRGVFLDLLSGQSCEGGSRGPLSGALGGAQDRGDALQNVHRDR